MANRFFLPTAPVDGRAVLDGPEAHHLLHVMRASVGDKVTLFDGQGGEYAATVAKCGRSEVDLAVGERTTTNRQLPTQLVMGVALPKGDRQRWLAEKLTELGVARLVPLGTERSFTDPKRKSLDRLERSVIEACKQCGRNTLMQIAEPQPLDEFLAEAAGTRLVADPHGEPVAGVLSRPLTVVSIVVGPEGGLSEAEVELASQHGWARVGLGRSILRIETAAVAIAAVIANHPSA